MMPSNKTDKAILATLSLVSENLGDEFDIPPKTAALITSLRQAKARLRLRIDDSLHLHLGWHILGNVNVINSNIWYTLIEELSEIYDTPIGIFSALQLSIRSDPSFMKVRNGGPSPFFVDSKGNPTYDRKGADRTTPEYLRCAWDGSLENMWDAEDLLTVPRIYGLTDEGAEYMMQNAKTHSGPDITVA
jgi:hypothetical protein